MAAQSLRSRRNPRRTHGIHSLPKTLLLRLQRPPSQTMIFSLLFCECRRWFTPSAFREPSLVYDGRFLRGSTRLLSSLCVLCVNSFFFLSSSRAQTIDNPLHSIDDEITAFSFGPNDAIAFSAYHKLKTKLYDLEHDDIWIDEPHGKRRHLLEGQKYTRDNQLFSYLVDAIRWSPNGRYLLVQLMTTTVQDESGNATNSVQTLLFDDSGHGLRIDKGDNFILASKPCRLSRSSPSKPRASPPAQFLLPT